LTPLWVCLCRAERELEAVRDGGDIGKEPELSSHISERPTDLVGAGELEQAPLLTWETTDERDAVDQIAWHMQQGAESVQWWLWTAVIFALVLLIVGFLPSA
jgi:hypothetical protein